LPELNLNGRAAPRRGMPRRLERLEFARMEECRQTEFSLMP
jgi:hypothetical protein